MDTPKLTFFCELDAPSLEHFFADPQIILDLQSMHAAVSLGIIDLTVQRAAVVRRLTEANIPVTAWLLLPKDQGYWFNLDNAPAAVERYRCFCEWMVKENLSFAGVGLDIEPDLGEMMRFTQKPAETALNILRETLNARRLRNAREIYQSLIAEIHRDGFAVETYQFPVIVDERIIGSTLVQRLLGVLDLHADREVLMLYSSFMGRFGTGILASYASNAGGIGIGSTGGGVEIEGALPLDHLTGETLSRDLRLVLDQRKPIYIFSLEGCAQ
ncbi:MAG: hypothetical protein ABFD44_14070, partial [Anaerolineaceae bacterium]